VEGLRPPPEFDHLHRKAVAGAESLRALGRIDHDDLTAAGLGHDLLSQQRPAPALDQVEGRVDLVGPIDREINDGVPFQAGDGDAQFGGRDRRSLRGGDAPHVG